MNKSKLSRRDRLALEIEQKQAQLKDLEARERTKQRKLETRRKIITGGIVLEQIEHDIQLKLTIRKLLDDHITSESDRKLFELSVIDKSA